MARSGLLLGRTIRPPLPLSRADPPRPPDDDDPGLCSADWPMDANDFLLSDRAIPCATLAFFLLRSRCRVRCTASIIARIVDRENRPTPTMHSAPTSQPLWLKAKGRDRRLQKQHPPNHSTTRDTSVSSSGSAVCGRHVASASARSVCLGAVASVSVCLTPIQRCI